MLAWQLSGEGTRLLLKQVQPLQHEFQQHIHAPSRMKLSSTDKEQICAYTDVVWLMLCTGQQMCNIHDTGCCYMPSKLTLRL